MRPNPSLKTRRERERLPCVFSQRPWRLGVEGLVRLPASQASPFRLPHSTRRIQNAFTLIEIMIVCGIMALVLTTSIPFLHNLWHKDGLRKAVADIVEVCSNARAMAIMSGGKTEVVIHPKQGSFSVSGGSMGAGARAPGGEAPSFAATAGPPPSPSGSGLSAQLPENILVEMLDINLSEYRESDEARVVFYPNGTCDELTIILHTDRNELRKISLEVTTGLASVESDPQKFK